MNVKGNLLPFKEYQISSFIDTVETGQNMNNADSL